MCSSSFSSAASSPTSASAPTTLCPSLSRPSCFTQVIVSCFRFSPLLHLFLTHTHTHTHTPRTHTHNTRTPGVLEVTRIRQEGFAWRPPFDEFVRRYKIIAFHVSQLNDIEETQKNAVKIIKVRVCVCVCMYVCVCVCVCVHFCSTDTPNTIHVHLFITPTFTARRSGEVAGGPQQALPQVLPL